MVEVKVNVTYKEIEALEKLWANCSKAKKNRNLGGILWNKLCDAYEDTSGKNYLLGDREIGEGEK